MTKAKKKIPAKKITEKKSLTKHQKILMIALIAVFVISTVCISVICVHNHKTKMQMEAIRERYVRYDACSEDLNSLVHFLGVIYPDAEKRPDYLMVLSEDLYEYGGKEVPLSKELHTSVGVIGKKGFVSEMTKWRLISFDGNRIQFDVANGNYALVYSPDGAPTYLHDTTDDFEILVEHIEGHWYHVSRMS